MSPEGLRYRNAMFALGPLCPREETFSGGSCGPVFWQTGSGIPTKLKIEPSEISAASIPDPRCRPISITRGRAACIIRKLGTGRSDLDTNNYVARKWKPGPAQGTGTCAGGGVRILSAGLRLSRPARPPRAARVPPVSGSTGLQRRRRSPSTRCPKLLRQPGRLTMGARVHRSGRGVGSGFRPDMFEGAWQPPRDRVHSAPERSRALSGPRAQRRRSRRAPRRRSCRSSRAKFRAWFACPWITQRGGTRSA
jgi:hypothetical protein